MPEDEGYELEPHGGDTPPWSDVQQRTPVGEQAIPVTVVEPVRADQLPTSWGKFEAVPVATTATAVPIVGADPRRAQITLWTYDADVRIASSRGMAQAGVGVKLESSPSIPIRIRGTGPIWAFADPDASGEAMLNIIEELWAR